MKFNKPDHFVKRIFMSVFGILLCGVAVSLFKKACFGVDPFQTLMSGLDEIIPISYGTLYVIVNALLLLFSLFFDRHYIGLATALNLFFLGYVIEYCLKGLDFIMPNPSIPVRLVLLIFGIVILCFSSAIYMTADMGVSTYDAIALIISNTWHKGKFKFVRIITDICCVLTGSALFIIAKGSFLEVLSIVSFGTIITAFFMGPLVQFFCDKVAVPFLKRDF